MLQRNVKRLQNALVQHSTMKKPTDVIAVLLDARAALIPTIVQLVRNHITQKRGYAIKDALINLQYGAQNHRVVLM